MSATDDLLKNAEAFADGFDKGDLPMPPARKVAILACMDARISPYALFGLQVGDAHVIRNAGGVVTDDEIRSLAISQRKLGTEEIILVHHTDCGMLTFTDDEFRAADPGGDRYQAAVAGRDASRTWRATCASRWPGSPRAPSSPTRTASAASSTRWRRAGCARSPRPRRVCAA